MSKANKKEIQRKKKIYLKRLDTILNKSTDRAYGDKTVRDIVNKYNSHKKSHQKIHHTKSAPSSHTSSSAKPVHIPNRLINTKIAFVLIKMYEKNHYTFTYHHNNEYLSANNVQNSFVIFRILLSIKFIKVDRNRHHHIKASLTKLGKDYVKKYLKDLMHSNYTYHTYQRKELKAQNSPVVLVCSCSVILLILSIIIANLDLSFIIFFIIILALAIVAFGSVLLLTYHQFSHVISVDKLIAKATRKSFIRFAKQNQIKIPNIEFSYGTHLQTLDRYLFDGHRTKAN